MAKIGCLKPFRGSYSSLSNIVLEDGEIAFATDAHAIYFGDGVNAIKDIDPFIYAGGTDISNIGDGSITNAISTINSKYLQYHKDYYQRPSVSDIIEDIVNTLLPIGAPDSKSFMWSGLNNNVAYYECIGQCGLNAVSGLYFDQAQAVFFYYYNSTRVVYHAITF